MYSKWVCVVVGIFLFLCFVVFLVVCCCWGVGRGGVVCVCIIVVIRRGRQANPVVIPEPTKAIRLQISTLNRLL